MMWKPSRYELCERGPYPSPTEVKAPRDWGSFEFDQPPISEFLEFELVMFGPNISGQVQLERPLLPTDKIKTGPFSTAWKGSYRQSFEGSYGSSGNDTIVFKANSASSIFGQGTTVQPASVRFLPAIKF